MDGRYRGKAAALVVEGQRLRERNERQSGGRGLAGERAVSEVIEDK